MKKKFFARALALVTSLSLLSTVAFAAPVEFGEQYIDKDGSLLWHGNDDGTQTYDYYLANDVTLDKTLTIKDGANASIDLNGYTLSGNGNSSVIKVTGKDTSLTLDDKAEGAEYESGAGTGTITGGGGANVKNGGGLYIDNGASVTMNGGTISGNTVTEKGGGVYLENGATFTMNDGATIDDNTAGHTGGGVLVNNGYDGWDQSKFIMNGGTISNNTASGLNANNVMGGAGGGVGVFGTATKEEKTASVDIKGGTISGNKAEINGAGVWVSQSNASIAGVTISDNHAKNIQGSGSLWEGGGIYATGQTAQVTVADSKITGNTATRGGGIYAQQGATVTVKRSTVTQNTATVGGGLFNSGANVTVGSTNKLHDNIASTHSADIYSNCTNGGSIILYLADRMDATMNSGKPVTGWYRDGATRWGDSYYDEFVLTFEPGTKYGKGSILCLKAAHDEYFNVVYTDGNGSTLQSTEVENKTVGIPAFEGELPTREGYNFIGWGIDENTTIDLETGIVEGALTLVPVWEEIPTEPEQPETPEEPETPDVPETPEDPGVTIPDPDVPLAGGPDAGDTATIEDEETPLAGIVTLAEMLEELRQREEIAEVELPEDFRFIDHDYAQALYWALAENLVADTEEEPLDPDEIVTVGLMQKVLDSYVGVYKSYAGFVVAVEGESDELVMDLGDRLTAFYGELEQYETAAEAEAEAEAETK